ncbi:MAG: hypothetical protein ACFCBU_13445 [Cyanophyceae cyanobacterium]
MKTIVFRAVFAGLGLAILSPAAVIAIPTQRPSQWIPDSESSGEPSGEFSTD